MISDTPSRQLSRHIRRFERSVTTKRRKHTRREKPERRSCLRYFLWDMHLLAALLLRADEKLSTVPRQILRVRSVRLKQRRPQPVADLNLLSARIFSIVYGFRAFALKSPDTCSLFQHGMHAMFPSLPPTALILIRIE